MPLFVGGTAVKEVPKNISSFHKDHSLLEEARPALLGLPCVTTGGERLLYLMQREFAVLSPQDECLDILGSEDATTCHLLVIRHSGSGVCALGHLDGLKTGETIAHMTVEVIQLSEHSSDDRLEVHVVGGFLDDRGESLKLSKEILGSLITSSQSYYLRSFVCTEMNDTLRGDVHFPLIYGIGVNVKTGAVFPSRFPERGPDLNLRGALCFAGYTEIHSIYDFPHRLLAVGPYSWDPCENALHYVRLPDHVIRKYMSTSPEQEPAYFEEHVRKAFHTLLKHPYPHLTLFTNGKPRLYSRRGENGEDLQRWKPVLSENDTKSSGDGSELGQGMPCLNNDTKSSGDGSDTGHVTSCIKEGTSALPKNGIVQNGEL